MEEDIKILNDYLDENDKKFVKPKRLKFLQAIENLINKNKELEEISREYDDLIKLYAEALNTCEELEKERDGIYADYQDLGKEKLELEKMVELMAKNIYNTSDTLNMLDIGKEINYDLEKLFNGIDDTEAIKIIIDYFRKKAKGE